MHIPLQLEDWGDALVLWDGLDWLKKHFVSLGNEDG